MGPSYRAGLGGPGGGPPVGFDAAGVHLHAWITLGEFTAVSGLEQASANDCWGYVAPSGREYAIIGLQRGTAWVEVTAPDNPVVVAFHEGPGSIWRDIKVYHTHAYAVSEGGVGIQVFDMSAIDEGSVVHVATVTGDGPDATHNVAIDDTSGFLYRCGGAGLGLRIYDLNDAQTPFVPAPAGAWPDRYVHDAQVVTFTEGQWAGRQIAFCCSGFNGGWVESGIDILDVTDKADVQPVARYLYPEAAYAHQAWLSEDRLHLYLDDEQDEITFGLDSTLHVIDVSNLRRPFQAATWTNGVSAVTHNLYVRGDRVFQANYNSGLRVLDISSPLAPRELAYFDTAPGPESLALTGLWSSFPFFPSGIVIGSDRQKGLFVWSVQPADLAIAFDELVPAFIHPGGDAIGLSIQELAGALAPGTALLHVDSGGGFASSALFPTGEDLRFAALFPTQPCGASVSFYVSAVSVAGQEITNPLGAPGFAHQVVAALLEVTPFTDDFERDLGWGVLSSPDLTDGAWQRADPLPGAGGPAQDGDGSGLCFVTGPVPGADVDGGSTSLVSPPLPLGDPAFGEAYLSYWRWFYNGLNGVPLPDALRVEISGDGGLRWQEIEIVSSTATWTQRTWRIRDFVELSDQVRVRFTAADPGPPTPVEAAIDGVRVVVHACPAAPDVNGDGAVDAQDLIAVLLAWGPCQPGPCPSDVDADGAVGVADLVALILAWG
jgi:choice-of-anchor B domain-containing protein